MAIDAISRQLEDFVFHLERMTFDGKTVASPVFREKRMYFL
jgi:hypothetical protein